MNNREALNAAIRRALHDEDVASEDFYDWIAEVVGGGMKAWHVASAMAADPTLGTAPADKRGEWRVEVCMCTGPVAWRDAETLGELAERTRELREKYAHNLKHRYATLAFSNYDLIDCDTDGMEDEDMEFLEMQGVV